MEITVQRPTGTYTVVSSEYLGRPVWTMTREGSTAQVAAVAKYVSPHGWGFYANNGGILLGQKPNKAQPLFIACPEAQAADEQMQAEYAAPRNPRIDLVAAAEGAIADWEYTREQLAKTDWSEQARNAEKAAEAAVQETQAALKAYDEAHPEETAQRKAQQQAEAEQRAWM